MCEEVSQERVKQKRRLPRGLRSARDENPGIDGLLQLDPGGGQARGIARRPGRVRVWAFANDAIGSDCETRLFVLLQREKVLRAGIQRSTIQRPNNVGVVPAYRALIV
jgi:hypothetical protein